MFVIKIIDGITSRLDVKEKIVSLNIQQKTQLKMKQQEKRNVGKNKLAYGSSGQTPNRHIIGVTEGEPRIGGRKIFA